MTTLICGAGTLGSRLVEHLARLGWNSLSVVDNDRVEERNLVNQSYFRHQVGQFKVNALEENVFRAVGTRLKIIKKRVQPANAATILEADLVVDCFDNHEARALVQRVARQRGATCLHIGISPQGYAEILWDEVYHVPPQVVEIDPCALPISSTLALLAVGIAARALEEYARTGERRSYTFTLGDLTVLPWVSIGSGR